MNVVKFLAASAVAAVTLFACGKDEKKKDDAAEAEAAPPAAPTPEQLAAAAAEQSALDAAAKEPATEFEGVWKTSCVRVEAGTYVTGISTYVGKTVKVDQTIFDGASCVKALYTIRYSRTFAVVGDYTAIAGARKVDQVFRKVEWAFQDEDAAAEANTKSAFGHSDWNAGEFRDVAGKKFSTTTTDAGQPAIGEGFFTIIKVDGTKLQTGDTLTGDAKSDATRPTALSTAAPQTKQ